MAWSAGDRDFEVPSPRRINLKVDPEVAISGGHVAKSWEARFLKDAETNCWWKTPIRSDPLTINRSAETGKKRREQNIGHQG